MQAAFGPAILATIAVWQSQYSNGTSLHEQGGSHELTLMRKGVTHTEIPRGCLSEACILLSWQQVTPPSTTTRVEWRTRILYRGSWKKTLAEWDRIVHTLDIAESERFYALVEQLEKME